MKDIMTMILTIVTLIASTKALNDLARVLRELNKTIEVTQINPLAFVSSVVLFFYKKRSSLSTRFSSYLFTHKISHAKSDHMAAPAIA